MPALDESTKERVKYHLGYLNLNPAAAVSYGIPLLVQPLYIVELAMNNVPNVALPRLLGILAVLDKIENKMVCGLDYLPAEQLGNLKINLMNTDQLEHEYNRWSARLADLLGVPRYLYSLRFNSKPFGKVSTGTFAINRS